MERGTRGRAVAALVWLAGGLLALAAPAGNAVAQTEAEPLWELGLGGGGGWLPDYPAAGQNHLRGLALPYVVYRGEWLRAGEDRALVRGIFFDSDRIELDISLAGSLPVDSGDNDAREGLDDLDYLGEIGPSLSWYFARDEDGNELRLDLQFRAMLSTDLSDFDYVGLVFHPMLAQEFADAGGIEGLDTNWAFSLRFADEGVMDLFYEVPLAAANAERAEFDAEAGYLGASLYGGLSYQVTDRLRLAVGGSIASYAGARNRDSALFVDETNFALGTGFVWSIWQSERRAKHRP
jgi:outer membrane scaffolding protein for murein synthesis (MipA/OmpV family)